MEYDLKLLDFLFKRFNESNTNRKINKFKQEIKNLIIQDFKNEFDTKEDLDNIRLVNRYGKNKRIYFFEIITRTSIIHCYVYDHIIFKENKIDIQIVAEKTSKNVNKFGMYYTNILFDY